MDSVAVFDFYRFIMFHTDELLWVSLLVFQGSETVRWKGDSFFVWTRSYLTKKRKGPSHANVNCV